MSVDHRYLKLIHSHNSILLRSLKHTCYHRFCLSIQFVFVYFLFFETNQSTERKRSYSREFVFSIKRDVQFKISKDSSNIHSCLHYVKYCPSILFLISIFKFFSIVFYLLIYTSRVFDQLNCLFCLFFLSVFCNNFCC